MLHVEIHRNIINLLIYIQERKKRIHFFVNIVIVPKLLIILFEIIMHWIQSYNLYFNPKWMHCPIMRCDCCFCLGKWEFGRVNRYGHFDVNVTRGEQYCWWQKGGSIMWNCKSERARKAQLTLNVLTMQNYEQFSCWRETFYCVEKGDFMCQLHFLERDVIEQRDERVLWQHS